MFSGLPWDRVVGASPGDGKRWLKTLGPAGGGFAGFDGVAWRVEIGGRELLRAELLEAASGDGFALTRGGSPVFRALSFGRWRAVLPDGLTEPADWMSPPVLHGEDGVGFVVLDGRRVSWRSYRARAGR